MRRRGGLLAGCMVLAASAVVATPAATPSAAAATAGCAWYGETDQRDVNVGTPDLDAHYWLTPLVGDAASGVTVHGRYPHARYFSLTTYDQSLHSTASLYDAQLRPDHGSANPFRAKPPHGTKRRYTVHVVFAAAPKHPRRNTLYAGKTGGQPALALLTYRVYAATDRHSPQGGVPFPTLTTDVDGSQVVTQGACAVTPPSFGAPLWEQAAQTNYPADGPTPPVGGASRVPAWHRQFNNVFDNPQNAYLGMVISRQYGPLVVVHGRAPRFPDNRKEVPPYAKRQQLRYWSICTNDAHGQVTFGCADDGQAAIRHHAFTYVVSDPDARPRNATAKRGVTWLPWGGIQDSGQVFYRNMLPSPHFHHAAQAITEPGQSPKRIMGRYYPKAVYCTTKRFEVGGWKACFRAHASRG